MVEPISTFNSNTDHITNEQKDAAMTFLTITDSKNINIAIQYLEMCNFNLDQAITMFFEHQGQPQQTAAPIPQQQQFDQPSLRQNQQSQEITNYQNYLITKAQQEYEQSGLSNGIKYILSGIGGLIKNSFSYFYSYVPLRIRGGSTGGEEFKAYLQYNYAFNFSQTYNFQMGQFQENLTEADSVKQPLIVFIFTLSEPLIPIQLKFLENNSLKTIINQKFKILGLLSNSPEMNEISSEVPLDKWPCLACFRKNLYEKSQLIQIIEIKEETYNNIEQQLKECLLQNQLIVKNERYIKEEARKKIIAIRQQQQQFINSFIQNEFDGYGQQQQYQQQDLYQQQSQRERFEQDRLLRQRQEQELEQARQIEAQRIEIEKQKVEEELKRNEEEEKRKIEEIKKKQERLDQIAQDRQQLPPEPDTDNPDTVTFQFRLPDGSKYFWKILSSYKINTLFKFIETNAEIYANFPDFLDKFDLIQTIPFLSLKDKDEEQIQNVFPGSNQEILYLKKI